MNKKIRSTVALSAAIVMLAGLVTGCNTGSGSTSGTSGTSTGGDTGTSTAAKEVREYSAFFSVPGNEIVQDNACLLASIILYDFVTGYREECGIFSYFLSCCGCAGIAAC